MKNKWISFGIIAAIIIVVVGATIALSRSDKNNSTKIADDTTTDRGKVEGVTNNDSEASDNYKEALAKYLTQKGAVLYGAYWCPHCQDQKKEFGDALKYVDYVECDPSGENANPDECKAKDIESYPTWIYEGKKYTGIQSLSDLAQMVGFNGDSSIEQPAGDDASTQPVANP